MPVRTRLARLAFALLLPLLLGAQAAAQRPPAAPQTPDDKLVAAMHAISSHTILDWVKEMAADKYEGRLTGTPSYDAVAAWTAGLLNGWNFKPAGDAGTFFQKFPNPYTLVRPGAELKLHVPAPGRTSVYGLGNFWKNVPASPAGLKFQSFSRPAVHAATAS
ncbi:MAG: hypothetical protein R6V57_10810 [Vicinamibacterales bacterium]